MNKFILLIATFLVAHTGFSQTNVVSWSFESKKVSDKKYEVRLIAAVKNPWHIYSTTQPDGGPVPTTISFAKNPLATPSGKVKEVGKLETKYEDVFEIDTKFFANRVEFVQVVDVKGSAKTNLTGSVEFMACNDEQCLPPQKVDFSIALK